MRRTIWTAVVLAVCCVAPAAAQQVEKSPFAPAAPAVSVPAAAPAEAAPAERAPSLEVSTKQIDAAVRADIAQERKDPMGSRGWWTTVAAVVVGVVIAILLLD